MGLISLLPTSHQHSPEADQLCPNHPEVPGKVFQMSQKSSQLSSCVETLFHHSFPHLPLFSDTSQANGTRCGSGRFHLPLLCPCRATPAPGRQRVTAEGFGICIYTGPVTPCMSHMVGQGRVADVLLNHRLQWQLLRGSATPRGQRLLSKSLSCLAFMPHSWKKKPKKRVSSSGKQASAALEQAKEKKTWHIVSITELG